jgi:hypothetical protein
MTKCGYHLVRELLIAFKDDLTRKFDARDVATAVNHWNPGSVFAGLRNGDVIEITNGRKRMPTSGPERGEIKYQFTSSFLAFAKTRKGQEYMGVTEEFL